MRISSIILPVLCSVNLTSAFLIPDFINNRIPSQLRGRYQNGLFRPDRSPYDEQSPMNPPGPAVPADEDNGAGNGDGDLTISDILPRTRSINIFASLTRDVSDVSSRLESGGANSNSTVLAPLNSAMQSLPRKPWEDRPGDDSGVSANSNEDKAAENLKRFVMEHVVPESPWKDGKDNAVETLGGQKLWWEKRMGGSEGKEERRVIMPGEVVVDGVVGRVGNGEIWALRGVINYE